MKKLLILFVLLISLFGCEKKEEYIESSFFAMDTIIEIKISADTPEPEKVIAECEDIIFDVEKVISKTKEDSDTYIANTSIDTMLDLSPEFKELLALSIMYSEITEGAFDITVCPLKELWENAALSGELPGENELSEVLLLTGYRGLSFQDDMLKMQSADMKLDFGAIGKGYAAEKVCGYLEEIGVSSAILSFGGNVALVGEKKNGELYKIGLKDPKNTANTFGVLNLESGFVSVSGDYERYIEIGDKRFNHIIDPMTGYPVSSGVRSVTVICDNGALADALSTALFVMGKDKAMEFYSFGSCEFEAIIVTDDGIYATEGLRDSLKPRKGIEISY